MLFASLLSLALPLATFGASHNAAMHNTRHQQLAKRQPGEVELHKRYSNARWSFYEAGLGACGKVNKGSDFIVALNAAEFGGGYPGPHCFQQITMSYGGKTTTATIVDRCPGCPPGGLDLSYGLFTFFAPESVGIIYGEWNYGGGGGAPHPPPPPPPPKPEPTTTKWTPPPPKPTPSKTTPKPEPTTTPKPEPETTSSTARALSTSTRSSSSSTSKSTSASASNSAVTPVPTLVDQTSNLPDLNKIILGFGGIVVMGADAA